MDQKQVIARKIFIVADYYHNSDVSLNIVKQFATDADAGQFLLGLENYYHHNSTFGFKNCYGLEDPFIHCLVDSMNKLILARAKQIQLNDVNSYTYPQYVNDELKLQIEQLFKSVSEECRKFLVGKMINYNAIVACAAIRVHLFLVKVIENGLFGKYSFAMNEVGVQPPCSLQAYAINLTGQTLMKYKMDFRDHVFTHYAKDILKKNDNLPLVIFVGEEHLEHFSALLRSNIANCEVHVIRNFDLEKYRSFEKGSLEKRFVSSQEMPKKALNP